MSLEQNLITTLKKKGLIITFVESCTGGALASALTNISGASEVLKDSFVTYSNEAKIALGVPPEVIAEHSVYSKECAMAMADAGYRKSVGASIAVGVTGSLNRVDPANPNDSQPGEVFIGVIRKTESGWVDSNYFLKVNRYASRRYAKRIISDFVFRSLLEELKHLD